MKMFRQLLLAFSMKPRLCSAGWKALASRLAWPSEYKDVARFEALLLVGCVTQENGSWIAKTETLNLSNHENKVTIIVRPNFHLGAVVKSVMSLSAPYEKDYDVSFLASPGGEYWEWHCSVQRSNPRTPSNIPTLYSNCKLSLHRRYNNNLFEDIERGKAGARTHSILGLYNSNFFRYGQRKDHLWAVLRASTFES